MGTGFRELKIIDIVPWVTCALLTGALAFRMLDVESSLFAVTGVWLGWASLNGMLYFAWFQRFHARPPHFQVPTTLSPGEAAEVEATFATPPRRCSMSLVCRETTRSWSTGGRDRVRSRILHRSTVPHSMPLPTTLRGRLQVPRDAMAIQARAEPGPGDTVRVRWTLEVTSGLWPRTDVMPLVVGDDRSR